MKMKYNVVRTKRFQLKPMSVEAILQMNLLGHTLFLLMQRQRLLMLNKRNDGGMDSA